MSSFDASYAGIGKMIRSDYMLAEMMRRGRKVMEEAIATAPVGKTKNDKHSGRYKASFELRGTHHGGWSRNRAMATVANTAPEAIYVEYGNPGSEPYHTMLNALLKGVEL
jgi:hypothetical protein